MHVVCMTNREEIGLLRANLAVGGRDWRKHLESFTLDSTVFVQHSPEEAERGQLVSLVGGHNHQNVSPDGQRIGQQDHQERGETVRQEHVYSHQNVLKSKFPQLK